MRTLEGIDTVLKLLIIKSSLLLDDMRTLEGIDTDIKLCIIASIILLDDMRTLEGIDTFFLFSYVKYFKLVR